MRFVDPRQVNLTSLRTAADAARGCMPCPAAQWASQKTPTSASKTLDTLPPPESLNKCSDGVLRSAERGIHWWSSRSIRTMLIDSADEKHAPSSGRRSHGPLAHRDALAGRPCRLIPKARFVALSLSHLTGSRMSTREADRRSEPSESDGWRLVSCDMHHCPACQARGRHPFVLGRPVGRRSARDKGSPFTNEAPAMHQVSA